MLQVDIRAGLHESNWLLVGKASRAALFMMTEGISIDYIKFQCKNICLRSYDVHEKKDLLRISVHSAVMIRKH